jgi:hypothetical protein
MLSDEQLKNLRRGLLDSRTDDRIKLTKSALEAGGLKTGVSDATILQAFTEAEKQTSIDDSEVMNMNILTGVLLGSEYIKKKDQLLENLHEQFVGPLEGGRRRRRRGGRKTRKGIKSRRRTTRRR